MRKINGNFVVALFLAASTAMVSNLAAFDDVIVVTTSQDIVDFPSPQMVVDLPGPDGLISFREACKAANNTAGPQTIEFQIPMSDWHPLSDQMALLQLEDGPYVISDNETTIDFRTQTDFTGNTNPFGNEVGIYGFQPNGLGSPAITVSADFCHVIGLGDVFQRGYAVLLAGNFNRIEGCIISGTIHESIEIDGGFFGPPATGNVVGGVNAEQKNRFESLLIAGPSNENIVIGNEFDGNGIRIHGSFNLDLRVIDNRVGGTIDGEGNTFYGAGYYGEEGFPVGRNIQLFETEGTIISGNQIGLLPDGVTPVNQVGPTGIEVRASLNCLVQDNVVVGMKTDGINHADGQVFGSAIVIHGACDGTVLEKNRVGLNRIGESIPNLNGIVVGVFQDAPTNTLIGGTSEVANIVANSDLTGITVFPPVTGVTIRGNRIFDNGGLGIDLGGDGVTQNDASDNDSGANQLQNFPEISSVAKSGSILHISGELQSSANDLFTLEFYASAECDQSGFGEGQIFLGTATASTDMAGAASFDVSLTADVPSGWFITSTATLEPIGATSEFSACVDISLIYGDVNLDGSVNLLDVAPFVELISSGGYQIEADINEDGIVNLLDVSPFISLLNAN